jgi:hypothetical protein
VLASLNHPNIGAIHGIEDAAASPYGRAMVVNCFIEMAIE